MLGVDVNGYTDDRSLTLDLVTLDLKSSERIP